MPYPAKQHVSSRAKLQYVIIFYLPTEKNSKGYILEK